METAETRSHRTEAWPCPARVQRGAQPAPLRQSRPLPAPVRAGAALADRRRAAGPGDRPALGAVLLAARLAAGRDGPHPLHPCADGLAGDGRLSRPRHRLDPVAGLAPPAGRPRLPRAVAGRRRGHRAVPGHRQPLGQADVGDLVGLGCAADQRAGAVLPLARPCRAGARLRRCRTRRADGGDPGADRAR